MKLNRSTRRNRCEILRHELQHVGQDGEIHVERLQRLPGFLDPQGRQCVNRDAELTCALPQRVGRFARLLRSAKDAGNDVAPLDEGIHRRLAEVPLPHDGYAHHPSTDISYITTLAYNSSVKTLLFELPFSLKDTRYRQLHRWLFEFLDSSMIDA